jgi:hypothetical protein
MEISPLKFISITKSFHQESPIITLVKDFIALISFKNPVMEYYILFLQMKKTEAQRV